MKDHRAKKITIEIMKAVLVHQNGYALDEVEDSELASECEGHELFSAIEQILLEN